MAVSLGYLYERGLADGRGNVQFNDDVSCQLYAVSAGVDLTLIESLSLHLGYIYRRKDFTSELLGDTHLNRHDDSHLGMAEFRYRLMRQRFSPHSASGLSEPSTVVTRDFNDTIYSLGGSYRFWPWPRLPAGGLREGDLQRDWRGRGKAPGKGCSLWLVRDMGVQAAQNLRQVVGEFLTEGFVAKADGRQ